MTTPLGIRTVWKSLVLVAGIALAGVAWLSWRAPTSQPACGGIIVVDVPPRTTSDELINDTELTKADILVGMRPMRALVQACYERYHQPGLANVELEISPQGTVTSARILGSFYGTATGACVEAAVRHATFRPTKTASNINYPFMLRPSDWSSRDAESEAFLLDARDAYVHGQYDATIALARKAVDAQPIPAWRLIGASSCFLHDRDGAMRAWRNVDHQGRAFLHYVCSRSAVTIPY